jgi:hypothetical protein
VRVLPSADDDDNDDDDDDVMMMMMICNKGFKDVCINYYEKQKYKYTIDI